MMYKENFVAVIRCNGDILRERNDIVYLPFGSQYSILLKNMSGRKALVNVEVDGEDVLGGSGLIMNANSSEEIKGFMRNMHKTNRFKFINKTKEIQQYRGDRVDDGIVRVSYRFTKPVALPIYDYIPPTVYRSIRERSSSYTPSNLIGSCSSFKCCAPLADEGITVKGTEVAQDYVYGDIGTLESTSHTIIIRLKGRIYKKNKAVKKPLTVRNKIQCVTCGRKNKSSNKFCYNCGTCLD